MLAYYINNVPLALNPNASVRITWYNPACYFEEIPGDVAMGIELPINEVNRAILGNPERFEKYTTKNDREFPNFEIRFSGRILIAGTLIIQSNNDESYSGWARNNVGNLGAKHRDQFIYDIPAFRQNITFNNKASYNPLTDAYGCPTHFNPEFFRDKGRIVELTRKIPNPDYVDLTFWEDLWEKQQPAYLDEKYKTEALSEAFRKSTAFFVNKLNPDNTVETMGSTALIKKLETDLFVNVLSPMLFLNFLIEMLLRDAHFFIRNNAIKSNPDLQKLILYNNFDVTKVQFVTDFIREYIPPFEANGVYFESTSWSVGSVQNIQRSYYGTFRYRDLIPKIKLKDFFLSIQNLLNVCFHFHRDGKVDIIDRETIITSEPIDLSNYLVGKWNIEQKKDVTLKFLFSHDDNDVMFSEHWTDIDDLREFERDPVQKGEDLDLLLNPEIGEIRFITNSNIYVRYTWIQELQTDPKTGDEVLVDVLGWQHLSGGLQNGFFNRKKTETEEIKTSFSTLMGGQTVITHHKGNMETMKFAYENFTPRLLFYMGNNIAKNETANISLDWEKINTGLLATRWSKWNRFWCQRQPVSINAMFTLNMLDYISRNITNRFRSREGTFIIETMETEFNLETIGNTKISGYKSNYLPATATLDEHWLPGNLIMDDTLVDFDNIGLNFDTDLDLFPFGTL
jgi:hypothetical protein